MKGISYDPMTGILTRTKTGKEAGYLYTGCNGKKYRMVKINGMPFYSHRVAWEIHYGFKPNFIDHINGDGLDNRICNLRNVSQEENQRNVKLRKGNKTGIPGVSMKGSKFKVTISSIYLGMFSDFFEACCARKSEERKRGFHYNHGKIRD